MNRRRFSQSLLALALGATLGAGTLSPSRSEAAEALTIIAPAKPGGGWDQTARAMREASLQGADLAAPVTVENVPAPAARSAWPSWSTRRAGSGDVLMVNGLVMVGAHPHQQVAGDASSRRDADRAPDRRI